MGLTSLILSFPPRKLGVVSECREADFGVALGCTVNLVWQSESIPHFLGRFIPEMFNPLRGVVQGCHTGTGPSLPGPSLATPGRPATISHRPLHDPSLALPRWFQTKGVSHTRVPRLVDGH